MRPSGRPENGTIVDMLDFTSAREAVNVATSGLEGPTLRLSEQLAVADPHAPDGPTGPRSPHHSTVNLNNMDTF